MLPLHWIDYAIILAYLVGSLVLGLLMTRRAARDNESYFLGRRSIPWWLNGVSLAATSLAADTPLAVTELVRGEGLQRLWWLFKSVMVLVVGVFLFARLWRRLEAMTDAEFCELRYDGRAATVLRATRAFMNGIVFNLVVIAWVTLGMASVISVMMPVDRWVAVAVAMAVTMVYTMFGGFFGAVLTELVQFCVAVAGMLVLAIVAVKAWGGLEGVIAAVQDAPGYGGRTLRILPAFEGGSGDLIAFVILLSLWWGDAGGYVMQRMSAARDERDAAKAMLFFAVWQSIRPWMWVPVALVSIALWPGLPPGRTDTDAYPLVMNTYLGFGLRGLLITAFAAAFMSTVTTHLNWGASYLMRDGYARFLRPSASERECVFVARLLTVALACAGIAVTPLLSSVSEAWEFLAFLVAGSGVVAVFRWFWWRINAWTELTAVAGGILCASVNAALECWAGDWVMAGLPWSAVRFELKLGLFSALTIVASLAATFLTAPVERAKLEAFYRKARPGGWWGGIDPRVRSLPHQAFTRRTLWYVSAGLMLCMGANLAVGHAVLQQPLGLIGGAGLAAVGGAGVWHWFRHACNPVTNATGAVAAPAEIPVATGGRPPA